jgi:cytochrome c biogenesis protein CcmG/thiol:disulfide interchange protein DsbE
MKISSNKDSSIFVIAFVITLILTGCSNADTKTNSQSAGTATASSAAGQTADNGQKLKDAPDFTLNNMDGEPFTLSEHEDEVVVLNVWATWCPPCRKEIPDFIEIQKEMRDEDVLFVGVSVDKEGWEVVKPFAKKYGINYQLVVDDGTINQKYGPFRGIPTTFIINKKGKVEYVAPGMINREALQPVLEKLANR